MARSREKTLTDGEVPVVEPPPSQDGDADAQMSADEAPTEEVEARDMPRARRPGPPPAHAQPLIPPPVGPPPAYADVVRDAESNPRRRRSVVTTPNQPQRQTGETEAIVDEAAPLDDRPGMVSGELSSQAAPQRMSEDELPTQLDMDPPSMAPSVQVSPDATIEPSIQISPEAMLPSPQAAPDDQTHEAMRPTNPRRRRNTPQLNPPPGQSQGPGVAPQGGIMAPHRSTPPHGARALQQGAPPAVQPTAPAAAVRPGQAAPTTRPGTPIPAIPSQVFARQCVGMTDVGAQREKNEDAFFCDDNAGLYLVCDGMGGHASGQVASEMAIRTVVEVMLGNTTRVPGQEPLVSALQLANQAILSRASRDPECKGMGTTAVGFRAENDLMHICHIGDSRAYLLRGGRLQQVTEDHSLQNLYKRKPELMGKLGPAQSNVIVRAIGLEQTIEVDHRTMAMEHNDLFLLCCDGLTDLVADWMIQIMTSDESLAAMAEAMIRAANANGGLDNITVILVRCQSPGDSSPTGSNVGGRTLPGF